MENFIFCAMMDEPESSIHLFHSCTKTDVLWMQQQHSFQNILIIPPITPQSAIFGFIDHKVNYHLINHILLTFKYYVYKTRKNGSFYLKVLKRNIYKIKIIEKQISPNKPEKRKILNKVGSHCQKKNSTYFEIYRCATVRVGDG